MEKEDYIMTNLPAWLFLFAIAVFMTVSFCLFHAVPAGSSVPKPTRNIMAITGNTALYMLVILEPLLNFREFRKRGYRGSILCIFNRAKAQQAVNTPVMSKIGIPSPGDIIYYYRYGNEVCEAVFPKLEQNTKDLSRFYYIELDSKAGKRLLQDYPIVKLPAIVLVKQNGEFRTEHPAKITEDGRCIYVPDALAAVMKERLELTSTIV